MFLLWYCLFYSSKAFEYFSLHWSSSTARCHRLSSNRSSNINRKMSSLWSGLPPGLATYFQIVFKKTAQLCKFAGAININILFVKAAGEKWALSQSPPTLPYVSGWKRSFGGLQRERVADMLPGLNTLIASLALRRTLYWITAAVCALLVWHFHERTTASPDDSKGSAVFKCQTTKLNDFCALTCFNAPKGSGGEKKALRKNGRLRKWRWKLIRGSTPAIWW